MRHRGVIPSWDAAFGVVCTMSTMNRSVPLVRRIRCYRVVSGCVWEVNGVGAWRDTVRTGAASSFGFEDGDDGRLSGSV